MPIRRLVSPTGKPIRLAPVRPNAGIGRNYQARIDRLVGEMHRSLLYWLSAAYRATPPEGLAQDASPAAALQAAFRKLARRWQRRFDEAAPQLARYFAQETKDRSERDLAAILKRAGMTVEFKMTPAVQDAYSAVIGEQVGLIRSIAQEHLSAVEGLVMRSVQQGRDLGPLTKQIEARYGLSRKRAALIARDQNNKATATITKVRQQGLGLTQATWLHSTAGKHPRASHLAFSGKTYDIAKGAFLEGKWVWPGTEINCLPGDALIDLVNGCHVVWRHHYRGDMVSLEAGHAAVCSTPNHPFLADKGWVAAQAVNAGDHIWQARHKELKARMGHVDQTKFRISDVFAALASVAGVTADSRRVFDFHGDVPDAEVETVRAERHLLRDVQPGGNHSSAKLGLADPHVAAFGIRSAGVHSGHAGTPRSLGDVPAGVSVGLGEAEAVGGAPASEVNAQLFEAGHDGRPGHPIVRGYGKDAVALAEHAGHVLRGEILETLFRCNVALRHDPADNLVRNAEPARDGGDGVSLAVEVEDGVEVQLDPSMRRSAVPRLDGVAPSAQVLAQLVRIHAEVGSEVFEAGEFVFKRVRVCKKNLSKDFAGYVYTLQSNDGWYSTTTSGYVTQNCRCVSVAIVPGA